MLELLAGALMAALQVQEVATKMNAEYGLEIFSDPDKKALAHALLASMRSSLRAETPE